MLSEVQPLVVVGVILNAGLTQFEHAHDYSFEADRIPENIVG